uniref:Uncharacterized protein n=1 Tax=viral metagenome TaxID=1070528 RepID=A0A6C0DEY1_9ZZZZ
MTSLRFEPFYVPLHYLPPLDRNNYYISGRHGFVPVTESGIVYIINNLGQTFVMDANPYLNKSDMPVKLLNLLYPSNIPEVERFCLSLISEVHQTLKSTKDYRIVLGGGNALKLLGYEQVYPGDFDTLVIINPDLDEEGFNEVHKHVTDTIKQILIRRVQDSSDWKPVLDACNKTKYTVNTLEKFITLNDSFNKIPDSKQCPFSLKLFDNYSYVDRNIGELVRLNITELKLQLETSPLTDLIDFTVPLQNYKFLPAYWAIYKNNTQFKGSISLPTDIAIYGAQRITELSEDRPDKVAKQQKRAKKTQVRLGHQENEAKRKGVPFPLGLNTNNTTRRVLNRKNLTAKRTATRSNTNYIQKMIKKLNNSDRKKNNNALTVGNIYDTYLTD